MPADLIWTSSLTFQQPEPVPESMTVTYTMDVPSFSPNGIPFLFGAMSFGPKWPPGLSKNSGSQVVYWRSAATGERTGIGFAGSSGLAVFTFYFPTGVFIEGQSGGDNLFLADGGSIEVDVAYTSPADYYVFSGTDALPTWAEAAWEAPNLGMVAFMWDVVGLYTTTSNEFYQVVVEGIMEGIPHQGGFSNTLSAAVWTPGQSPYENVSFEFPMWGFDPANDTAWTLATQFMQPQTLAQNVGDSGTVDEGQTTFYSANMITQYTTDSGQIGFAAPTTEPGLYEIQLPVSSGTDFFSLLQNYHIINPKYLGMPYDIESHVDFHSADPVVRETVLAGLTQLLPGSIAIQTIVDPLGFTVDPASHPYSVTWSWYFAPDGIFIQMPAGTITLLGLDDGDTVIFTGPVEPFDLDSGAGLASGGYIIAYPEGVVSFTVVIDITREQLASHLGIVKNSFNSIEAVNNVVAVPASGDVTFNLQWYTGQLIFDFDTQEYTSGFVPLGDPIAWSIPSTAHSDAEHFQRVSTYSSQENFVPVPDEFFFGSMAYNVIAGQGVADIPDPDISYLLDIISVSVMLYSGGQQTYTKFAANGGRMLFPVYYPPMNWPGVAYEALSGYGEVAYFTGIIANVQDDNVITLVDPAPTTVGNSWNYAPLSFTGVGNSYGTLLFSPGIDIPLSATHAMVDISCDLDPAATTGGLLFTTALPAMISVSVVGTGVDNVVNQTESGNYVYSIVQPPDFSEQFMLTDYGNSHVGDDSVYGGGSIGDMRWYINSNSPVHRICRLNSGGALPFGQQQVQNLQLNILVRNIHDVPVNFDVNIQFFRLEPTNTVTYGSVSVLPQNPLNTPTIQNAGDSMPAWQDMVALAAPDMNFIAAQYAGDRFLDTWNIFQSWPPLTDADYASEVAVSYGETAGVLVQTAVPDEPFYAAQTNLQSAIYSIIFRQFPQSSTCVELGAPLGCGFTTTQTLFNNFNPGPPNPVTLDPSLVVVKAYALHPSPFTSFSVTAFLMADGTVWCGGVGGNLYGVPSPWGASGWDYVPRPLTVFNLPPMIDMELCAIPLSSSTFDLLMLDVDRNLWAWGFNITHQFGQGGASNTFPKDPVIIATNVTTFHGTGDAVIYASNGLLYVAGSTQFGTLGLPVDFHGRGQTSLSTFTQVPGLKNIHQITSWGSGGRGYAVLDENGTVWGWVADNALSNGSFGILGQSVYQTYNSTGQSFYGPNGFWVKCPDLGTGNIQIQASAAPFQQSLYTLTGDGNILVTGHYDNLGSAGDGDGSGNQGDTRDIPPKQVLMPFDGNGQRIRSVGLAISQQAMSMIGSDGNCYAWGTNQTGALGLGALDFSAHPTPSAVPNLPPGISGIFRGVTTTLFYYGALPGPTVPLVTVAGGQVVA